MILRKLVDNIWTNLIVPSIIGTYMYIYILFNCRSYNATPANITVTYADPSGICATCVLSSEDDWTNNTEYSDHCKDSLGHDPLWIPRTDSSTNQVNNYTSNNESV